MILGGASGRSSMAVAGTLAAVLSFASPATAHNWMHTPARALMEASTTAPCRGRKGSDTHAQVGPNQPFVIKWATGHSRPSYWVVVHGSNEHWLRARNFTAMVNDYLANAPPGSNTAMDPRYQRYHGVNRNQIARFRNHSATTGASFYAGEVMPGDPNFLNHSRVPTQYQFRFSQSVLEQDHRTSYRSARYPWIEAAYKYEHVDHRPGDWDGVRVTIPGRSGPGHYVVHWRWSGYYDCVDADYFDDRQVANSDGVETGGHTWNKQDHCQYQQPFRQVLSECTSANAGARPCKDAVSSTWWTTGTNARKRLGINVVPLANPTGVAFPGQVNIPWLNRTCSNSQWTTVGGTVTESAALGLQARLGAPTAGQRCSSTRFTGTHTLRQAMFRCQVTSNCNHIVGVRPTANTDLTDGRKYTFYGCSGLRTTTDPLWTAYSKPAQYASAPQLTAPTWTRQVSFQPASTASSVPSGWIADTGAAYGNRGGDAFGWRCPMPQRDSGSWNARRMPGMAIVTYSRNRSANAVPEVYNTFVQGLDSAWCPDGHRNQWEMQVPNGVYRINTSFALPVYPGTGPTAAGSNPTPTSYTSFRPQGCFVEDTEITSASVVGQPPSITTISRTLEVNDGRVTLSGLTDDVDLLTMCQLVNAITIERVGTAYPQTWVPPSGSGGAWWQQELSGRPAVGLVTINPTPGRTSRRAGVDCRYRMMLEGDHCQNGNNPLGNFSLPNQGFVVSLSDQPCTDAGGCPTAGGHVCRVVRQTDRSTQCDTCSGPVQPQNYDIDCHGQRGRYLRVHLPGAQRLLPADVTVNVATPPAQVENQLVCYAVEAREQTETSPEFVVSDDPRDPVFYSTCFVREMDIQWLPPPGGRPVPETPSYRFGDMCIDCTSYTANRAPTNATLLVPPAWRTTSQCVDCNTRALGDPSLTCDASDVEADQGVESSSGGGGGGGGGGSAAAGIAVGVILAIVTAVALTLFVRRRRAATAASKCRSYGAQRNAVEVDPDSKATYDNPLFSGSVHAAAPAPSVPMPTRKPPGTAPLVVDRSGPVAIVNMAPRKLRASADADDTPFVIRSSSDGVAVGKLSSIVEQANRPPPPARVPPPLVLAADSKPAVPTKPNRSPPSRAAAPPPRPASVSVGPAWEALVDKEANAVYFHDPTTGAVQWDSPFPPCWSAEVDGDGDVYWVNAETGESQWEVPSLDEATA